MKSMMIFQELEWNLRHFECILGKESNFSMFMSIIYPQTRSKEEEEDVGGTLSLDGKTQNQDGLETFIWSSPEYEWTWLCMNLTTCGVNGCSPIKLFYPLGMRNGSVNLATNL